MATFESTSAPRTGMPPPPDVVEIGLLLPISRVNALIELSRKKRLSVGQMLRDLIDRALMDGSLAEHPETAGTNGFGTFV
jgi:hypothetical protein